ncbi:hypothetical protein [Devosia sp.]|uniref:hypothetical protein n=1 Tax=Devosia sp. TaxID=1871048 RepID=UPI003A9464C9
MTSEAELSQSLIAAQRAATSSVDPSPFTAVDIGAGFRIQAAVMAGLGETVGMLKTAVSPDGVGVAAPIFASRVGEAATLKLPAATVIGIEVEIAAVLKADIATDATDGEILAAIDHYVGGIEICGSRFTDRSKAGYAGGLADSMSAYGYGYDPTPRSSGDSFDGLDIVVRFKGEELYRAPAEHGFGAVNNSLMAYARNQQAHMPLKAGMRVTTGSLCGLVPSSGPGRVEVELGAQTIALDLV